TRKPWNHASRRNAICKFLGPQPGQTGKKQFFPETDQTAISMASTYFTGDDEAHLIVGTAFRSAMKDFGPSCFHSASTGGANANAAPEGGA
ncbi:hypothetical protein, partial [Aurantimonas sp. VKM B-3413]|uniref:hypothetical protein n=1 Tax=Aurantimonas sp. VKM B-3413 TaxID=2779401 RepID=UPI001E4E2717